MNELHKAFAILDLEPGSSLESIIRQYRQLAKIWHPDRVSTKQEKDFVEVKLKQINNAKDFLIAHFRDGKHREKDCDCQPQLSNAQFVASNSASLRSRQKEQELPSSSLAVYGRSNHQQYLVPYKAAVNSWFMLLFILLVISFAISNVKEVQQTSRALSASTEPAASYYCRAPRYEAVDVIRHRQPIGASYTTALPLANLPATLGVDSPLPKQMVQRPGLPLLPLGSMH